MHFFVVFFLNSVLLPFQDYFSSYETGQSVGGRKRENPEKNHLAHPQAEYMHCSTLVTDAACQGWLKSVQGFQRRFLRDFTITGMVAILIM